ncbi:hypothetical protein ACDA63_09660 [Uliginosibacterium sp. sgz301328]|uniref:hypothetical protein n=1 Tax=Uliginosibacterium sp. sgz301328 TaxID=3243764 RepID=UPI00359DBC23
MAPTFNFFDRLATRRSYEGAEERERAGFVAELTHVSDAMPGTLGLQHAEAQIARAMLFNNLV